MAVYRNKHGKLQCEAQVVLSWHELVKRISHVVCSTTASAGDFCRQDARILRRAAEIIDEMLDEQKEGRDA